MNYPVAQSTYQGNGFQPPQLWSYQPPYYTPLPHSAFVQQPRQQNHEGLLGLLVVLGFLFSWIDSRRQKTEILQLQQQVHYLSNHVADQGIEMNQPQSIGSQPTSSIVKGASTSTSFGDGTHFVGDNGVQPGIYRLTEPGLRYYVARLRNFTGQNAILANWNGVSPGIIEILPTDAGVEARGGATWQLVTLNQPTD